MKFFLFATFFITCISCNQVSKPKEEFSSSLDKEKQYLELRLDSAFYYYGELTDCYLQGNNCDSLQHVLDARILLLRKKVSLKMESLAPFFAENNLTQKDYENFIYKLDFERIEKQRIRMEFVRDSVSTLSDIHENKNGLDV